MKMIKTVMAGAVAMALVSFGANAANQGQGVVNFKGSVINAPCGIARNLQISPLILVRSQKRI